MVHTVYLCLQYFARNTGRFFPEAALTAGSLQQRRTVLCMRWELSL